MLANGEKTRQVVERFGGAGRARTGDLIVANDALSQLSYSPTNKKDCWLTISFYQRSFFRTTMCPYETVICTRYDRHA
jgi:hypothetical protein